jgi:flagellar export protein FliJ
MKRFEFSLRRVLDLRKQQAEMERARLQALLATLERLRAAKQSLNQELQDARTSLTRSLASGNDYRVFADFEQHIHRRCAIHDRDSLLVQQQVRDQQAKVRDADQQVKLLENLKAKKLEQWNHQLDKELEELASDSYLARMSADRRRRGSL